MDMSSRLYRSMEEWEFAMGRMSVPGMEVGVELGLEGEVGFCPGCGQGVGGYMLSLGKDTCEMAWGPEGTWHTQVHWHG